MVPTALFTGRFQPPSIAHVSTVETILQQWRLLTIGVSVADEKFDFDPIWQPYIEATRENFNRDKAVFAPKEVQQMWQAWIICARLTARVTCELVPRPHMRVFAERYPKQRFDFVYPSPHETDSSSDRCRHDLFPKLLGRKIFLVDPPLRLHNSEILRQIRSGMRTWKNSVAPGALEVFIELNGPVRMVTT